MFKPLSTLLKERYPVGTNWIQEIRQSRNLPEWVQYWKSRGYELNDKNELVYILNDK